MSHALQARRPHAPYHRRRALLGALVASLLIVTASVTAHHGLGGAGHSSAAGEPDGGLRLGERRGDPSSQGWPPRGQGAYVLSDGRRAASPGQQPVPIASVAKVMTAYVVLKRHPLAAADDGPRFAVDERDVAVTEAMRRDGQSVVAVRAGERLTERQALLAILLPSANNVAMLLARQVDGSLTAFVAEMNRTARALGMSRTTYTDPSGYDDGTVSTARDQLRLARVVAADETLAAMMATRSAWLPEAGTVTNTDALLGRDGFVGLKTGSDRAAGGCFMFRAVWPTETGTRSVIGVVLGQRGGDLIGAGLDAARQLVARLAAPDALRDLEPPQPPGPPGP